MKESLSRAVSLAEDERRMTAIVFERLPDGLAVVDARLHEGARATEIDEHRAPMTVDEHVSGMNVAVEDSPSMQRSERSEDIGYGLDELGPRPGLREVSKVGTIDP